MPLPKDKALLGSNREVKPVKIKVADISENPDQTLNQWGKIASPFLVTYKIGTKEIKSPSSSVIKPKDWLNCFKLNDAGYVQYKRWSDHIMTLATLKHKEGVPVPFDANSLIGFEFQAELVELEGRDPFIDWMSAFFVAGIATPSAEDLDPIDTAVKVVDDVQSEIVDGELPF